LQLPLIAPDKDQSRYNDNCRQHNRNSSYRPDQSIDILTQPVAPQPVERGADDPPKCVEQQKAATLHAVDPRQEGSPGTEHRDKSPEEDDLATMPAKHIDPHCQPALLETDIPAIA